MLVCLALSAGSPRRCIDARGRKGPCGPGNSDCDAQHPRSPAAAFHVFDLSCGENDPNAPVYDARHGVYHLFYQDSTQRSQRRGPTIESPSISLGHFQWDQRGSDTSWW